MLFFNTFPMISVCQNTLQTTEYISQSCTEGCGPVPSRTQNQTDQFLVLPIQRRPAHLSAPGAGCPLLRRDQISKIRRGPPSVDHRDRRERKPHRSHHRQATNHRGGTASSHTECQPNTRCNLLILDLLPHRPEPPKPLLRVFFRPINYKTIVGC